MADSVRGGWLSVVTVSLVECEALSRTLSSIEEQGQEGVENTVVLGSSPSRALSERVAASGGRVIVEPPVGIYAAMNSGWAASSGEYVHFLNAGDVYATGQVLTSVRRSLREAPVDWLFGRMLVVDPVSGRERVRGSTLEVMQARRYRGRYFPELPATMIRSSAIRRVGGFDTSYDIAADYKLILEVTRSGNGSDLRFPIVRYELGGVSDTRWAQSLMESRRARNEVLMPTRLARVAEDAFMSFAFADQLVRRVPRRLRSAMRSGVQRPT